MTNPINLRELVVIPKDRYERLLTSRAPGDERTHQGTVLENNPGREEEEEEGPTRSGITSTHPPFRTEHRGRKTQECSDTVTRKKGRMGRKTPVQRRSWYTY